MVYKDRLIILGDLNNDSSSSHEEEGLSVPQYLIN